MKKILILTLCFLMCFITLTPTAFAKCSHKNTKWEEGKIMYKVW